MGGPPVYQHRLNEPSLDPSKNSLDDIFKYSFAFLFVRDKLQPHKKILAENIFYTSKYTEVQRYKWSHF